MIRFLYADQLNAFPKLRDAMFRDRADQFKRRLGWEVSVDGDGFERDEYDDLNPLYVIWETPDGGHGGSMRFLPSVGRTMVNDHFAHLSNTQISSPGIWECTRFCLAADATANVSALLMLAGSELMTRFGVTHFVGVFDARMVRIYQRIGAPPEVLGSVGEGRDQISVGLWSFTQPALLRLQKRAGVSFEVSRYWALRAFGGSDQTAWAA
ncbi:acyl-homoserine-lactone synthase [Cognatishimia sp. MH4019]|uniref:acyl-homoserine-lactone synthase n=1 Tax=Cognatishimia sp. MH4019 TaxID=2854030 RepID=UPI001CD6C6CA|nr:acyl-homoserine-lactone synthase [Cognatishimia sp. MH4019]